MPHSLYSHHLFFPLVLSITSIQLRCTPLFSSAFVITSFCGPWTIISITGFLGLLPTNCPTLVELAHAFCNSSAKGCGLMKNVSIPETFVTVLFPERVSRMILMVGALPALGLAVSLVSSLRRMAQWGVQLCRIRSMSASRGTLPLASTSRSREDSPSKTALARMGLSLTRRLFVSETRFSVSI